MEDNIDDIDIEEHDVLDHPRIRNIFPDLSIIKTEVLTDTEDTNPETYQNYTNMSIKEECNKSVEDFSDFDETLQQTYLEDDLPPEDIYHFNNKIILGSKPNPQIDETIELTVNLDAFVLLDDWGQHLDESLSYCKDCQILFATPNALDAHKMTAHSFLVAVSVNKAKKSTTKGSLNYARKSTTCVTNNEVERSNFARKSTGNVSSKPVDMTKFCNHCNITFPDHTSLITHLYELLPSKEFTCTQCSEIFKNQNDLIEHTRTHIKIETDSINKTDSEIKFTCVICNIGFSSYKKARKHKLREHKKLVKFARIIDKVVQIKPVHVESNDIDRKHIKVKVEPNKSNKICIKMTNIKVSKVKSEDNVNECNGGAFKNTPVPKSVLFQCVKCHVNFLRCFVGTRHLHQCMKLRSVTTKAPWQCKICTRTFRSNDRHMHKIQHKISGKFRVYKSNSRLYERVLSKCPKCNVCFDELIFKCHYIRCRGQPAYRHCEKCDLLIDRTRFEKHLRKHTAKKLKPKDFIVIEYFCDREMSKCIKKESAMGIVKKMKDTTVAGKLKFESDAEETKVKSKTSSSLKIDTKLKFEDNGDKIKLYFCKHCNRCSKASFIPESHKSKKCKKCLVRICDQCGLFFSYTSWPFHRELHRTRKFTIHDIEFYEFGTTKAVRPLIPQFPKCTECKIHFAGNKMLRNHSCGEDYKTCPNCNKMYDTFAYKLHKQFHDYGKDIDGEMMPELIKKYESLQKMWHILYLCDECDINMDSYDKAVEHCQKHFSKQKREDKKIITCFKCQLNFDDSCWTKHSDLHSRNLNINKKDFCILTCKPTNLFTDEWLKLFGTLPQEQVNQIISRSLYSVTRSVKMILVRDGRPNLTIYCCSQCKVSVNADTINRHVHGKGCSKTSKELCLICDVYFCNVEALREHQKLHIDGINKDEFRIVHFNINSDKRLNKALKIGDTQFKVTPIDNADSNKLRQTKVQNSKAKLKPSSVLYKCNNCNICLSSKYSRATHHCLADNLQRTCKICKQQFAYQIIAKHITMHKDNPSISDNIDIVPFDSNNTKIKQNVKGEEPIVDNRVSKIYKCDCGLHFTSLAMIEKHLVLCTPDQRSPEVSCSKCGLLFPTEVLVTHLCKHHSKYTKIVIEEIHKSIADTSIDNVDSTDVSQSVSSDVTEKSSPISKKSDIKLYKCSQCNVYFLTQATCYKHTLKHVPLDPKQYIECKLCSLQFTILSLTKHLKRHHNEEFNLEKVLMKTIPIKH